MANPPPYLLAEEGREQVAGHQNREGAEVELPEVAEAQTG